jgi:hypothetical protein
MKASYPPADDITEIDPSHGNSWLAAYIAGNADRVPSTLLPRVGSVQESNKLTDHLVLGRTVTIARCVHRKLQGKVAIFDPEQAGRRHMILVLPLSGLKRLRTQVAEGKPQQGPHVSLGEKFHRVQMTSLK